MDDFKQLLEGLPNRIESFQAYIAEVARPIGTSLALILRV
jgi:hypothetical protein